MWGTEPDEEEYRLNVSLDSQSSTLSALRAAEPQRPVPELRRADVSY